MSIFRKLKTTNRETEILTTAIDMWVVEWNQRTGAYSSDKTKAFQAFADKCEAEKFKQSLLQANKLIGNTEWFPVSINKQSNGLD